MQKGFYKKTSFEDKFDRKYACWAVNHPTAWKRYKKQNRRKTRRWIKEETYRSSSYIPVLKVMGNGELCQNRWMFVKSAKIKLQEC